MWLCERHTETYRLLTDVLLLTRYRTLAFFRVNLIAFAYLLQFEFEEVLGIRNYSPAAASFVSPAFGAAAAGATYFGPSGPRVAVLAGSIGFGAVAATYTAYTLLGIPYGSRGFLFF